MMARYVSRTEAMEQVCPFCAAETGKACVGARGKKRESVHRERMNAAAAAYDGHETRMVTLKGNKLVDQDGDVIGTLSNLEIDVQSPWWGNLRRGKQGLELENLTGILENEAKDQPERGVGETKIGDQTSMLGDAPLFEATSIHDEIIDLYRRVPGQNAARLTQKARKMIDRALKERDVEKLKDAVRGLAVSDYHLRNGFVALKYAIGQVNAERGIDGQIDMMAAKAPKRTADGRVTAEVLLRGISGHDLEVTKTKIRDVRRGVFEPSSFNEQVAVDAERWLREKHGIVVAKRDGRRLEWDRP